MAQITGRATIRLDGSELRSMPGARLSPGGVTREAVKGGGKIHGFKEEDMEPTLECTVAHTADLSLDSLAKTTAATISVVTDTGRQYTLREAWLSQPPELDAGNGSVALRFAAISCEEG